MTHNIDIQGNECKPPQTVNKVNTVLHTFDSLHLITPQLQKLTKVKDKFSKSTYTDMGLRYHLIQEDSVEPYLLDLIEGECKEPVLESTCERDVVVPGSG